MCGYRALLLTAVALTLTIPAAAQDAAEVQRETKEVTFYGHLFGIGLGAPMPANTEKPIGEDNLGLGLGGNCGGGVSVPDPTGLVGDFEGDCNDAAFNKVAYFSTAGFVDVKNGAEFLQGGGYAQLHNERGQTKDIVLDTSRPIVASMYATMDAHGWPVQTVNGHGTNCAYPHPASVPCVYPYWGWDPGVFNDVVFQATLYMANLGEHGSSASEAPPIAEAIDAGAEIVAQGQWGPDQVINGLPGYPNVNEFVIDLGTPLVTTIPRENDFFLVIQVYQEAGGQNYQVRSPVRWWSGELFPPSFTLPVKNAFDVERVIPNFAHGKLAILGVMNTPWGSYDIDPASVELSVMRGNQEVFPEHIQRFGEFSVAHGGHYLPINVTWIWDYARDNARPGAYEITVTASNFQGSASATCSASFELQERPNGRLVAGEIREGLCGVQTASEDFIEDIQAGVT